MVNPNFIEISIGLGQGVQFGITHDNQLVFEDRNQKRVSLGQRTKKQFNSLIEDMQRLLIHLPD